MNEPRGHRLETARVRCFSRAFMNSAREATVLGFDFGTRRIGVAVGSSLLGSARPLATIEGEANKARFAAIAALIDEWRPDELVVGIPVHADGSPHETTLRAKRFSRQLAARFGLPVVEVDERHTTAAARTELADAGTGGRRGRARRDEVAARLILQAYFDGLGPH